MKMDYIHFLIIMIMIQMYRISISEEKKILEDHTYPSPSQETFQHDIYVKRDYYIHNIPYRDKLKTYDEIKEFRDNVCARDFKLREHQALLANFINPNTPFKG